MKALFRETLPVAVVSWVIGMAMSAQAAGSCTLDPKLPAPAAAKPLAAGIEKSCGPAKVESLNAVWKKLLTKTGTGGKRFDTVPPPGTPTGKILPGPEGIEFDLRSVESEGIVGLKVMQGKRAVATTAGAGVAIVVPAAQLQVGATYEWLLQTKKQTYKGSFEILDADDAKEVSAQLQALAAMPDLAPTVREFQLAAIYDEADLYFQSEKLLAGLKRQLGIPER